MTAEVTSFGFTRTTILAGVGGACICRGKDGDLSASQPSSPPFYSCILCLQESVFLVTAPCVTTAVLMHQLSSHRSGLSYCRVYSKLQWLMALRLELHYSLCPVYYRAVMGQVSFFDQICLYGIASGCLPSRTCSGVMWIWHCPVWNIALNLPWKSHPLDYYHTPGWLLPQRSWHLLKVTYVLLLTLCSTSPLQTRLPGAIGIGDRQKSALLVLYQGITWGMLQATSLPLLLSPLSNLKDPFLFS